MVDSMQWLTARADQIEQAGKELVKAADNLREAARILSDIGWMDSPPTNTGNPGEGRVKVVDSSGNVKWIEQP